MKQGFRAGSCLFQLFNTQSKFMKKSLRSKPALPKHFLRQTLLFMKLCLILMTVTVLQLQAAVGYSQNRFSIESRQIELKKLLEWIETKSSYRFLYNIKTFPAAEKVDVKF